MPIIKIPVHATMKEAQAAKMQSLITSPELPLGNHGGDRQPEVASECVHCGPKHPPACDGRTDEEDEQVKCKDQLEGASPFLSMGPILRAFQLFGVFNFHIGSDYNSFQRRPLRLLYAIVLNVVCTAGAFFSYYAWCAHRQLGMDQLVTALRQSFTETDFVVFCMGATLFELSCLGLHVYNMGLCGPLNDFVVNLRELGVIQVKKGEYLSKRLNPCFGRQALMFAALLIILVTSAFLLGWFQPELLSVTDASFAEKLVQGLMMTIVITSWHLPQLLSEMLFVRQIIVLDHHFEHLTTHIKCCFEHKHMYDGGHTDSYEDSRCCLDHSVSMLKLFKLVEKTFCKQLSMLFAILMVSLVFAVYLAIAVLISGIGHIHIVAFLMYSLVPAIRLVYWANCVNSIIEKTTEVRHRLYQVEQSVASNPELQSAVRGSIRLYQEVNGFSACNFFTVNRSLLTSILGYFTTYIIVLVQFKISDVSN